MFRRFECWCIIKDVMIWISDDGHQFNVNKMGYLPEKSFTARNYRRSYEKLYNTIKLIKYSFWENIFYQI